MLICIMRFKVYYGGWYQRTTLHLSEVYDLLYRANSNLPLDKQKLENYKNSLQFESVTRESGYLEYVLAKTKDGITLKYFEDGLYLLETTSDDVNSARERLESFFDDLLNPAISYIFSLGAPTPKILANIKQNHPSVVIVESDNHTRYKVDPDVFGEVYSLIDSEKLTVFKTPNFILIAVAKSDIKKATSLVEMQIFFREFKDQLEKYLNIHRNIWEEITLIKEKGSIKGMDVVKNRMKLDSYDRSINLINNRINQMGSYVKTRQSMSSELGIEEHLAKVFDYKFETLINTLSYIKEVWAMTDDYVKNVILVLTDIENQSLNNSIRSLQVITSLGVVSGIFGYLSKSDLPSVTNTGWLYLLVLLVVAFIVNMLLYIYNRNIKYKIKIVDTSKNL